MRRPHTSDNASISSEPVPQLTHQPSLESTQQPITPGKEISEQEALSRPKLQKSQSDVPHIHIHSSGPQTPSKDLPFLAHDPYADDHIIPLTFDPNHKPTRRPSRSGSVRRMISASSNSFKSLKSSFGTLKRKLSTRSSGSKRKSDKSAPPVPRSQSMLNVSAVNNEFSGPARSQTYMMGPSFHKPQRVDTYQVSAMAF